MISSKKKKYIGNGGRSILNYNATHLSDYRNYHKSHKNISYYNRSNKNKSNKNKSNKNKSNKNRSNYRSIKNNIQYRYDTTNNKNSDPLQDWIHKTSQNQLNTKSNNRKVHKNLNNLNTFTTPLDLPDNKGNSYGYWDKETEKTMTAKDYAGPCPYYQDIVAQSNYVFKSGKLVKDDNTHKFKFTAPSPSINYKTNNKRPKNNRSNYNISNYNELTGGGIHWDNINPQRIYISRTPGAIQPGDINNQRYGVNAGQNMPGVSTVQLYSNPQGFGFQHADMVGFSGCQRHDAMAPPASDDNPYNERFFQIFGCGGIVNKVQDIEQLQSGRKTNWNLLFMNRPRGLCYCMSHFIANQAWQPYSWRVAGSDWITKYVNWQIRTCICVMVLYFTPGEGWSRRDGDGNTFFRYLFDLNNAMFLANGVRGIWGDPQGAINDNPWAYMCQNDINNGLSNFPVSNEADIACRDKILEVWNVFLNTYHFYDNYLDQYLYLWWLAGACMGTISNSGDDGARCNYSRIEVMMWRYPWGSTGINGQHEPMGFCQLTRYLTLIQKEYVNSIPAGGPGTGIATSCKYPMGLETPELRQRCQSQPGLTFPPLVSHMRDGHQSAPSRNSTVFENEWANGTFRYLISTNPKYCADWHERRSGWLAGVFSAKRDPNDPTMMPVQYWRHTFGRALAWHSNQGDPYLTICPSRNYVSRNEDGSVNVPKSGQWGYGLEEFVGSWMMIESGRTGWQANAQPWVRSIFCNTLWINGIMWYESIAPLPINGIAQRGATMADYNTRLVWNYHNNFDWNIQNQRARMPYIVDGACHDNPSWVLVFFSQYESLCKLALDFVYHYICWYDNVVGATWREVRDRQFIIYDAFQMAIADAEVLRQFQTNSRREVNNDLNEVFVKLLVLICPPVYAFLTTLFANSASQEGYLDRQYDAVYGSLNDVIAQCNTLGRRVTTVEQNPLDTAEDGNILYNIQRMNSIYQLRAHPRDIQKRDQNAWDFREWYAPEYPIRLEWREHSWFFLGYDGNEWHNINLFTDMTGARNGPKGGPGNRENCIGV